MNDESGAQFRSGLMFGLVAYLWWGLVPLYFAALAAFGVPAWEILAHRIAWSLPIMALLTLALAGWKDVVRVLRSPALVSTLLLSACLLALNWLIYIYATVTNRVVEASLGYYMMPLVNAALAPIFLKEKLRPAQFPALVLVALGVAIPFAWNGNFTWIAVALPITFGAYGLVRKKVAVESMTGLTVETILMLPPSLGFLLYLSATGQNHMTPADWRLNALIAFSGIVTVVPLLTYTLSLRRLPLLAVSFIQFLSPTVQMVIAVIWLGETLGPERVAAFVCVWSAVLIFIGDALWQARQKRRARRGASDLVGPLTPRFGGLPSAVPHR
ncbi:EamA family transporter RarD [Gemmata sp. JC717]|uniref:EamA family transporter RarD n=1 Tax=Gemmata algarum TaxID=2975278 RepID=A0ABU5F2S2_9BACT|nr:EamA family transporter RarD [Gemmata algarum]MDY3551743.1 EamA family transporter RarD [Gemmata algarum]MDY3561706.1 EamA family transporter RarD [Gemmata algarum]